MLSVAAHEYERRTRQRATVHSSAAAVRFVVRKGREHDRGGVIVGALLAICAGCLIGCPGIFVFQDQVDSACLQTDWMAEAAAAIEVEADTFEAVMATVLLDVPLVDGNWAEDFGDARFYGPAILLGLGHELNDPCLLAFGQAAREGNRNLIRIGQWCPLSFWPQLPEQVMAAYGLIETYRYERRADDLQLIDAVLDRVNPVLESLGLYVDELTHLEGTLYGPTTLSAAAAGLNLRYALQVGGPRAAERAEYGLRVIDAVNDGVYDAERGIYRFSVALDQLHLYPNVMMIIANCLAYEATGDVPYLERARATFENIQPLKDPRQGNYHSPYSAGSAGARTEDYSSLSSQLYLITALCLLYESTGQAHYEQEARNVLRFVCTYLRDDGRLVHHWIDGRPAGPGDSVYYCSGCNFQALYVMWYMTHLRPVLDSR
jgi:hypothetical protein